MELNCWNTRFCSRGVVGNNSRVICRLGRKEKGVRGNNDLFVDFVWWC